MKQLSIQAIGGFIAALLVAFFSAGYFARYFQTEKSKDSTLRSIEIITRADLKRAVEDSKKRIIAAGYVMNDVDADLINRKPADFLATVVVVDPLGAGGSNSVICQRQRDEEGNSSKFEDYDAIVNKLKQFNSGVKTKSLIGNRLKLGVIDYYPTMTVMMIDDDLYAYFYPYLGEGSNSPVIKFNNYWNSEDRDKRGNFFAEHLNRITWYDKKFMDSRTKFLSTDSDFKQYENKPNPCISKASVSK